MTTSIVLGVTLALLAGFCTITIFTLTEFPAMGGYRWVFVWGWLLVGIGLLLGCLALRRRNRVAAAAQAAAAPEGEEEEERGRLDPFRSLAYWAGVAGLFAGISLFIEPWEKPPQVVRAEAPRPPLKTNEPPRPPAPLPPTSAPPAVVRGDPFAKVRTLRVQGVTLNGRNSTVLLSGRTYVLGEEVDGARVEHIYGGGVILEKEGQSLTLRLE